MVWAGRFEHFFFFPGLVRASLRAEGRNNPKTVLSLINWDLNLLFPSE